ncbi:protein translocase subunit SecD [bacterium]|nr:protein translocase subunit SecD [bacterium]
MKNIRFRVALVASAVILSAIAFFVYPINLGLDLQGGSRLVLEARDTPDVKVDNDAVEGVLAVIRNRVDSLGVAEPIISRKGPRQIVVELPGVQDPERALKLIGDTARLEFVEAEWAPAEVSSLNAEQLAVLAGPNARIDKLIQYDAKGKVVSERPIILKTVALTGADLKMASPGQNQYSEGVVNIEFTTEGAEKFKAATTRSVGRPLAIILDGKIISAPNVNEPIAGGRAQISGRFSVQELRDLVIQLKAGALPVPVEIVSNKVVGPTLGKDSIEKSKLAGMIGFAAVCLFMVGMYRLPGAMASVGLLLYTFIFFSVLKAMGATLTLPGIAGFILTIGIAVDANVIIFERIKEERQMGLSLKAAIDAGFDKAFWTIVDANVSTLIATVVLFWFGTGTIRGFAVTLSTGILVSMFTAITVTRLLLTAVTRYSKAANSIAVK